MSGSYTAVHCICTRLRQVDDGINRGIAGCATGLVMGWGGSPSAALQSCLGFGLLSYIIDFGGGEQEAKAASFCCGAPRQAAGVAQRIAAASPVASTSEATGCIIVSAATAAAASAPSNVGGGKWKQRQQGRWRGVGGVGSVPPVMWLGALMSQGAGGEYMQGPGQLQSRVMRIAAQAHGGGGRG